MKFGIHFGSHLEFQVRMCILLTKNFFNVFCDTNCTEVDTNSVLLPQLEAEIRFLFT